MDLPGSNTPVLIRTYPELARELFSAISRAKSEIYIASRYYEPAIGSKLLEKFAEGVSIHVLDSNSSGVTLEERIRSASTHDSKNRSLMLRLLDTPNSFSTTSKLNYSFSIVDGKYCGLELIDPENPDNFTSALKLENTELANQLIAIFQNLAHVNPNKLEFVENVGQ